MGSGSSIQSPHCSCPHGGYDLPYNVFEAATKGQTTIVDRYLRQDRGNVNATYKGDSLLHAACSEGRENVLTMLMNQKELCINQRNGYNETPLMVAAQSGYKGCVELLLVSKLRCPLDIHCKNNYGHSAVDLAHIKNQQEVAYCMTSFLKNTPPNEEKPKPSKMSTK